MKFAGFWWRIIRINGDGTIRIIYDGTEYHANGSMTTNSIAMSAVTFNRDSTSGSNTSDNVYVGFMYGIAGSNTYERTHANVNKSLALTAIDNWYFKNLSMYSDYIDVEAGFCGDRSINLSDNVWDSKDLKKGYEKNTTYYGAYSRFLESGGTYKTIQTPTFKCIQENDLYTLGSSSKGNKALRYPIALISVDEIVFAGGLAGTGNQYYYLCNNNESWTMTPAYYGGSSDCYMFYLGNWSNAAAINFAGNNRGLRPVINLRADLTITGSGVQGDEYEVSLPS